ncbi:MAG TPA: iron ABC transporter permease [Candidatus Acidoferrales bacterium]|nr:iron ABC transporter permease [Candidatus Acidoferrales bacterium]
MTAKSAAILSLAAMAALFDAVLALMVGGTPIAPAQIVWSLAHPHALSDVGTIVWSLRLPRVVIAALVGAALATAGFELQGLLRNPLVDPSLVGVSAGAGAAIAIGVALGVALPLVPGIGFGAGLGVALLVALLARRGGRLDVERLILAGVSLSAFFAAIVTMALTALSRGETDAIIAWLAGSLAGHGWIELGWALPYAGVGFVIAVAAIPSLNALRLGPALAVSVGVDVVRVQWLLLASAALLTAAAVSLSGMVGFVGLIVPHLARRLIGTDARCALPLTALLGAILVTSADAVSRTLLAPAEIPLGVLLAFFGVPTFLYLYLRSDGAARLWGT